MNAHHSVHPNYDVETICAKLEVAQASFEAQQRYSSLKKARTEIKSLLFAEAAAEHAFRVSAFKLFALEDEHGIKATKVNFPRNLTPTQ